VGLGDVVGANIDPACSKRPSQFLVGLVIEMALELKVQEGFSSTSGHTTDRAWGHSSIFQQPL
jgi:hypothetical protein